MKKEKFDELYTNIICPNIEILKQNHEFEFISTSKLSIEESYIKHRDFVKKMYMQKGSESILDRHKVAACIMMAIVKVKPLVSSKTHRDNNFYLNEMLAIQVAFDIVCSYLVDDQIDSIFSNGLSFPVSKNENGQSFLHCLCLSLYYGECSCSQDILAYSSLLFMVEAYTELYLKTQPVLV